MILVTGARGFLGKNVCKLLEESNKDYYKTSLSLGVDFRKREEVLELFEKVRPKYVMHCASYVGGLPFTQVHPAEIYYYGLLIQANLFEACRMYEVKRIVNPISNCAYPGNAEVYRETEFWDGPLHESVEVYGMVRKMSYIGAKAYHKQHGMDVINLVFPNMYGPGDHLDPDRAHALGALIVKILNAKKGRFPVVNVYGTGKPIREWLYIEDAAIAMVKALDVGAYDGIINIGVSEGISIKEMAEMICKYVGYDGILAYDTNMIDGAKCKIMDGKLGQNILSWKPQTSFEEGLKRTVDWYAEKLL